MSFKDVKKPIAICFSLAMAGCAGKISYHVEDCFVTPTNKKGDAVGMPVFDKDCARHKESFNKMQILEAARGSAIVIKAAQLKSHADVLATISKSNFANSKDGLNAIVEMRKNLLSSNEKEAEAARSAMVDAGITEQYLIDKQAYYEDVIFVGVALDKLSTADGEPNFAQYAYIINEMYTGKAFSDPQLSLDEIQGVVDAQLENAGTSIERLRAELEAYNATRPHSCEAEYDEYGNVKSRTCTLIGGYDIQ